MSNYNLTPEGRDPQLWRIAQSRASFWPHLRIYLIMSAVFWAIWYFSGGRTYNSGLPWPVWPMFGWGIGVVFHYIGAFVNTGKDNTEKEYEKLVNQNKR